MKIQYIYKIYLHEMKDIYLVLKIQNNNIIFFFFYGKSHSITYIVEHHFFSFL